MITDNLIAELKLYIKENYKLISWLGKKKKPSIADKAKGVKTFSEVTDLMSGFIKEKRDYENFAHLVDNLRKQKGLSPAELYKAAWIDKRVYSKLVTTPNYRPARNTAISFGLALKLKPPEFADFLQNAGFALSDSSVFDLVIRFCVEKEIYSLYDVNALLLQADQKTLVKEEE
jgi:hypothetical protein